MKGAYAPMLAVLVDDFPSSGDWVYEKKFDGYRAIAVIQAGKVSLYSRNGILLNNNYPSVPAALTKLPHDCVLDGEVIHIDKAGRETFQGLQQYGQTRSGTIQYCVFDLLKLGRQDITHLPLLQRKELLATLVKPLRSRVIKYVEHVEDGRKLFAQAESEGWEGVIGKRANVTYLPGKRTDYFVKIKTSKRQEAIICGYTAPAGSRKHFGALLLGVYIGKELHYAGKTGTGFTDLDLKELFQKMQPLIGPMPFAEDVKKKYYRNVDVTWLKPALVCEIKFTEWTGDMRMRHPSFQGLRTDKKAKEVILELPKRIGV
ncbi:hypothetical protein F0L74_09690 [Chitinophaga agrisoli]|uniref:DNA ligase (ATP) n=1 Tax=Chitinophaga agrisoli TaxID=2607653 RepID=A0A5B2VVS8_9BACT|nr:non-homologous end-joining DNA ligase [Chitinophaga agrisoli]KAA2242790.1 hypothetical protein F0L74_09690 [Chitinophaga agrisoli]